jgi:hypothetical protein
MANDIENAVFAYSVYAASPNNQMPLPAGWTQNFVLSTTSPSGFAANVYAKGTGEVVIAFRGTDTDDVFPLLADFLLGNIPAATGAISTQVQQAIQVVADTMQAYPGAAISFTGHSLGGGLASLTATNSDQAAATLYPLRITGNGGADDSGLPARYCSDSFIRHRAGCVAHAA